MKKYSVEMTFATCVTANVYAESIDEAIIEAKKIAYAEVGVHEGINTDTNGLNLESVNNVIEMK